MLLDLATPDSPEGGLGCGLEQTVHSVIDNRWDGLFPLEADGTALQFVYGDIIPIGKYYFHSLQILRPNL